MSLPQFDARRLVGDVRILLIETGANARGEAGFLDEQYVDDDHLTAIFQQLYLGQVLAGWSYEDLSFAQLLMSESGVWARQVSEDGATGVWVRLPSATSA